MYPTPPTNILARSISLIKNIKWADLLDNTQKTLSVINQAIPIAYQIKPLASNAKTLLKIASIINNPTTDTVSKEEKSSHNSPIFYI